MDNRRLKAGNFLSGIESFEYQRNGTKFKIDRFWCPYLWCKRIRLKRFTFVEDDRGKSCVETGASKTSVLLLCDLLYSMLGEGSYFGCNFLKNVDSTVNIKLSSLNQPWKSSLLSISSKERVDRSLSADLLGCMWKRRKAQGVRRSARTVTGGVSFTWLNES